MNENQPLGTTQCPILGCGENAPHAHEEGALERLNAARIFLASDGPLPERAMSAAKLLRKALVDVQGIGPRGSSEEVDAKWRSLSLARETLEVELYYLPSELSRRAIRDIHDAALRRLRGECEDVVATPAPPLRPLADETTEKE